MMLARELCGDHIGKVIEYKRVRSISAGTTTHDYVNTEDITMILHKKNGTVHVRHGRNNRQLYLSAMAEVTLVNPAPVVYSATWPRWD